MNSSKSRRGFKWLTIITVTIVFTLVTTLLISNWNDLISFPWHLNLGYLILTLVFQSIALGVTFLVWHLMVVRLCGFDDLAADFRFYYVSTLAKRVPMSVWYIGGRVVMYKQAGVSGLGILNGILFENVLIAVAGILTFVVFLPFYSGVPTVAALPIAVGGAVSILILLARPRIFLELTNAVLRKFHRQELTSLPGRRDILIWTGIYVLPWLFAGLGLYCATRAFSDGGAPGLVDSIGISTLTMLIALISMILPGGFGLKELTSGILLSKWMPLTAALVITVAYRLLQTGNEVVWAIFASTFVRRPGFTNRKQYKGVIED